MTSTPICDLIDGAPRHAPTWWSRRCPRSMPTGAGATCWPPTARWPSAATGGYRDVPWVGVAAAPDLGDPDVDELVDVIAARASPTRPGRRASECAGAPDRTRLGGHRTSSRRMPLAIRVADPADAPDALGYCRAPPVRGRSAEDAAGGGGRTRARRGGADAGRGCASPRRDFVAAIDETDRPSRRRRRRRPAGRHRQAAAAADRRARRARAAPVGAARWRSRLMMVLGAGFGLGVALAVEPAAESARATGSDVIGLVAGGAAGAGG